MTDTPISLIFNAINSKDLHTIGLLVSSNCIWLGSSDLKNDNAINFWENHFQEHPAAILEPESVMTMEDRYMAKLRIWPNGKDNPSIFGMTELIIRDDKIIQWTFLTSPLSQSRTIGADERISGLGGVFIKCQDPKSMANWYDRHLGTNFTDASYHSFKWRERRSPETIGRTEFSLFKKESEYFVPSQKDFMLNFRVRDLNNLLEKLKVEGVKILTKPETFEYGSFAWILDLEGNKIELWEPIDAVLEKYDQSSK